MPRHILYHVPTDLYIEYSTVVDAPTTIACTREEMRKYLAKTTLYEAPMNDAQIDERLDRAMDRGCSASWTKMSFDQALVLNRAGLRETEMSVDQFVDYFFVKRKGAEEPPDLPIGEVVREYDESGMEIAIKKREPAD